MITVFNAFQVQAAVQAVAFTVVNPQFAATAADEILNEFEWQLQVG